MAAPTKAERLAAMRELAAKRGGKCLAKRYVDSTTRYPWQCAEGHVWRTTVSSIRGGGWCGRCHIASLRRGLPWLHKLAKVHRGRCLSKRYTNVSVRYRWQCKHGHRFTLSGWSVSRGGWCPVCRAQARPIASAADMQRFANAYGIECLSRRYVGSHTRYRWRCAQGHVWRARYSTIREGRGCPRCAAPKTRTGWTAKEDRILLRYYAKERAEVVQRLPGRTLSAVRGRIFVLRQSRRKTKPESRGDKAKTSA